MAAPFPPPWLEDAIQRATPLGDSVISLIGDGAASRRVAARADLPARTAYLAAAAAAGTRADLIAAATTKGEARARLEDAVAACAAASPPPPSSVAGVEADPLVAALWSVALPAGLTDGAAGPQDAAWVIPPAAVASARQADGAPAAAAVPVRLVRDDDDAAGAAAPASLPNAVAIFTLRDVAAGEELTLDWAPSGPRSVQRAAALLARFPPGRWASDEERAGLAAAVAAAAAAPPPGAGAPPPAPRDDAAAPPPPLPFPSATVWTDYPVLDAFLDAQPPGARFVRTPDRAAAAVVVSTAPLRSFDLPSSARVSQFPYEGALIRKDLLPATLRGWWAGLSAGDKEEVVAALGPPPDAVHPPLLPPSYDLASEAHWLLAAAAASPAPWMVKPATAARSAGLAATAVPATLAAFRAAAGGDRVAQRALTAPATHDGRKYDLRVLVAVRSFSPPSAALLTRYHARVAAARHDAAAVADRAALTTVSCYDAASPQLFLGRPDLDASLAAAGWAPSATQAAVAALARAVVAAGATAVGAWPRCGALYGLDVMLDTSVIVAGGGGEGEDGGRTPAPRLLEVNFAPDLKAAASFNPGLPGDVLAALFGGAMAGAGLDEGAWAELF